MNINKLKDLTYHINLILEEGDLDYRVFTTLSLEEEDDGNTYIISYKGIDTETFEEESIYELKVKIKHEAPEDAQKEIKEHFESLAYMNILLRSKFQKTEDIKKEYFIMN